MYRNGSTKQGRPTVRINHSDFYPEGSDLAYGGISVSASSATEPYFLQSFWIVLPSGEAMPLNPSASSDEGLSMSGHSLPFLLEPKREYNARVSAERLRDALASRNYQGVVPLTALVVDSAGAFHCSELHEFDMDTPASWRPTPEEQVYRRSVESRMAGP